MIETAYTQPAATQSQPPAKILKMVKNERMGGMVPAWVPPETGKEEIAAALTNAVTGQDPTSENLLSYNPQSAKGAQSEEFKFGDLVDMVNPLHHVPVVGHVYREITGDEIRPIGRIMGGAIFGGPVGAASGLVNVVVEEETGKDLTGNAMAMVRPAAGDAEAETTLASFSDLATLPPREPITQVSFGKTAQAETVKTGLYAL